MRRTWDGEERLQSRAKIARLVVAGSWVASLSIGLAPAELRPSFAYVTNYCPIMARLDTTTRERPAQDGHARASDERKCPKGRMWIKASECRSRASRKASRIVICGVSACLCTNEGRKVGEVNASSLSPSAEVDCR